jgi:hypothetical protein
VSGLKSLRHRAARASILAGEEEESVGHEELEKWRERLAVVAAHFAGAAVIEARPLIFASLPDRTRFSAIEAKEFCSLWLQAALLPIHSTRLPAFFEFLRADLKARDRDGQPRELPRWSRCPPPEPRRPLANTVVVARNPSHDRGSSHFCQIRHLSSPDRTPEPEREPVAAVPVRGEPEQPPGSWNVENVWHSRLNQSPYAEFSRGLRAEYDN